MTKTLFTPALMCFVLIVFTGCDLGTYSKRLNDRSGPVKSTEEPSSFSAMRQMIRGEEITTTWEFKGGKVVEKKVNGEVVDSPESTEAEVNSLIQEKHQPDPDWRPKF